MVLPRLAEQAVRGEPMTVYGDGRQTRCFAHVRDVTMAMATLARRPQASGQVVNVGNDTEVSILELAQLVRQVANSASAIRTVPEGEAYPVGFEDIRRRRPDLSGLRRLLGQVPTTSLRDIVSEVVAERRLQLAVANG